MWSRVGQNEVGLYFNHKAYSAVILFSDKCDSKFCMRKDLLLHILSVHDQEYNPSVKEEVTIAIPNLQEIDIKDVCNLDQDDSIQKSEANKSVT